MTIHDFAKADFCAPQFFRSYIIALAWPCRIRFSNTLLSATAFSAAFELPIRIYLRDCPLPSLQKLRLQPHGSRRRTHSNAGIEGIAQNLINQIPTRRRSAPRMCIFTPFARTGGVSCFLEKKKEKKVSFFFFVSSRM